MPVISPPPLSVAMSVYNADRFLDEAIASIRAQSWGEFEFLILNDGSIDGSRSIIDAHAAADPRIVPIHRENRGLVASLNELLERARAPIVARMDADDIALPERFERQLAFLRDHPDYGVIGCWTTDIDEAGEPFALSGADHPVTHRAFLGAIAGGPLLCHPSAMMRVDAVRAVGGYHAAFRHCEDYDLWLRLAGVTRLGSLPERLLKYRHTESQVSSRHAVEQQTGAAIAYLAWRERSAGRPDPTATLDRLPPVGELDALFGRAGVDEEVRARVAPRLLYSRIALSSDGYDLLLAHIREGGRTPGLWRTVARLVSLGEPARAARLAATLAAR